MKLYVVTQPRIGQDYIVGIFSDEKYVYSKYSSDKYNIDCLTVNDTKFVPMPVADLKKHGRTDFVYKFIEASKIKCIGDFETSVHTKDGHFFETFNIIDPHEGDFYIKFDNVEQKHNIDSLSVVADLFCKFTNIYKEEIVIFKEKEGEYFLGTTTRYKDSLELWESFNKKGVEVYY